MSQNISPVPPLEAPGEFPTTADRTAGQYNAKAINWANRLAAFGQSIWDIAVSVFANAGIAMSQAQVAVNAAASAASVQDAVWSAVNFKGLWQELAGPMNKPATVRHNGRMWLLLRNVADITAQEPGVSSDWSPVVSSVVVQEVSASAVMQSGVHYVVRSAGITLTLPAAVIAGDQFSVQDASGAGFAVNWGAHTVKGRVPDAPMSVPSLRGFAVIYSGSTFA